MPAAICMELKLDELVPVPQANNRLTDVEDLSGQGHDVLHGSLPRGGHHDQARSVDDWLAFGWKTRESVWRQPNLVTRADAVRPRRPCQ